MEYLVHGIAHADQNRLDFPRNMRESESVPAFRTVGVFWRKT